MKLINPSEFWWEITKTRPLLGLFYLCMGGLIGALVGKALENF